MSEKVKERFSEDIPKNIQTHQCLGKCKLSLLSVRPGIPLTPVFVSETRPNFWILEISTPAHPVAAGAPWAGPTQSAVNRDFVSLNTD